jgi:hypothetical protein
MGYSLSWLAVKGMSPQAVREALGLVATGAREEFPESELTAAELPGGWYLVVAQQCGEQVASDEVMSQLSQGNVELVTCFVEEHCMVSTAGGWRAGRKVWSVIHDAQKGRAHLEASGELPAGYEEIRNHWQAKQDEENQRKPPQKRPQFRRRITDLSEIGCDYLFEIPVETAAKLTDYRHDEDISGQTGDAFEVLEKIKSTRTTSGTKPSFWQRLFGR